MGPRLWRWPRSGKPPIDLLLTDVVMPGMNGRELALRMQRLRRGLRVLFTSGYARGLSDHDEVTAVNFVGKPYSLRGLAEQVRGVLDAAPDRPGAAVVAGYAALGKDKVNCWG